MCFFYLFHSRRSVSIFWHWITYDVSSVDKHLSQSILFEIRNSRITILEDEMNLDLHHTRKKWSIFFFHTNVRSKWFERVVLFIFLVWAVSTTMKVISRSTRSKLRILNEKERKYRVCHNTWNPTSGVNTRHKNNENVHTDMWPIWPCSKLVVIFVFQQSSIAYLYERPSKWPSPALYHSTCAWKFWKSSIRGFISTETWL